MKYSKRLTRTAYSPIPTHWHQRVNGFQINFKRFMKNDGVMLSFQTNGQIWTNLVYVENGMFWCINKRRKQLNFDEQDFVLVYWKKSYHLFIFAVSCVISPLHLVFLCCTKTWQLSIIPVGLFSFWQQLQCGRVIPQYSVCCGREIQRH